MLPADVFSALIRIALIGLIYLFLFQVVRALSNELGTKTSAVLRGIVLIPRFVSAPGGSVLESSTPLRPVLVHQRATLGRGPDVDVTIPDVFVSGEHAAVFADRGRWWVVDLGSTNGTLHNGRTLSERSLLEPGDVIQIGRVEFQVAPSETD